MNIEPKSIIPFMSVEGEGLVSKLTVMLVKPVPLEEIIEIIGSGKGKRLTNDPAEQSNTPDAQFIAWEEAQLDRLIMAAQDMKERLNGYERPTEPTLIGE